MNTILHCNGKKLDLSRPNIMGILNLSPLSFSQTGKANSLQQAILLGKQMAAAGAAIIDIGAEPTHPAKQQMTTEEEELAHLLPVIHALKTEVSVPLSVDTSRPRVMEAVINAGAHMINDVRALQVPGALEMAAALSVPICLMYMRYLHQPDTMPTQPRLLGASSNIMHELQAFFEERIFVATQAGIARERLILDPGIGGGYFGKSTKENLTILRLIGNLKHFNLPIVVGASRKSFLGDLLNVPVEERLAGSLAAAMIAIQNGSHIIRVHDVTATRHVLTVLQAIEETTH